MRCHKNSKINKTSNFFDDFFAPKQFFEKNHYWVAIGIDCFEPIFGFLRQFWFQKHRADTWDPKEMFSAPSERSEAALQSFHDFFHQSFCFMFVCFASNFSTALRNCENLELGIENLWKLVMNSTWKIQLLDSVIVYSVYSSVILASKSMPTGRSQPV